VNQIEVARTRNDGFDEYDRHTPENIKALRAAFAADKAGVVSSQSQGLHGYIGFSHDQPPAGSGYSAGMGFYAAVWPLIDQPLADFQIGLPSSWVTPDNSDNKDQPLAPGGTLARTWKERGCP
jgi:hypothetical protein